MENEEPLMVKVGGQWMVCCGYIPAFKLAEYHAACIKLADKLAGYSIEDHIFLNYAAERAGARQKHGLKSY